MTSADASSAQLVILAILCLTAVSAFLGDAYATMIALQHGYVEGNPITKWLFRKIGPSFTAFLSAVAILFFGGWISTHSLGASYVFLGGISLTEGAIALRNYLKLKAAKISLK